SCGSLAFSADGMVLACGCDDVIRCYHVATGKELVCFRGDGVPVHSLAFSPDGKTLACGLANATALIWNLGAMARRMEMLAETLKGADFDLVGADLAGVDA